MIGAVGVVGYKDSGKTTWVRALSRELAGRDHRVAVIKHTSHQVDLAEKDTAALLDAAGQVAILSSETSGVFWRRPMRIEDVLAYLDADIVLVEGLKGERTYPKIACLRDEPDDRDLFEDGLVIAAVGAVEPPASLDVPFFRRDGVAAVADLVERRAFKLPALDCAGCGHETCYDMARAIVAGEAGVKECVSLAPTTDVKVDGRRLALNPFISQIVRSTILGMLSPLKGFSRKGKVEINL
jgi:molybdopterin-guanine dinucleotide biosynthesis protein B